MGRLDLAPILAQFRRDPGQAQGFVDLLFLSADDFLLAPFKAVLAQAKALALGQAPQGHVVCLAAGEILEERAVTLWRQDAQVYLETIM